MHFFRSLGAFALSAAAVATLGALTLTTVVAAVTGTMLLLASPASASETCGDEIISILKESVSTASYRFVSTVDAGDTHLKLTGEVVPGLAMYTRSEQSGEVSEQVFADGRGFVNYGGTWSELPAEMADHMMDIHKPEVVDVLGGLVVAECDGEIDVDGTSYLRFSYTFKAAETHTNFMLADPATRRPVRIEAWGTTNNVPYAAISTYEYDPTIAVTAPIL